MSATGERPPLDFQSGTTLVEALVVVAITSLLFLIGFPSVQRGLAGLAQRQAAVQVAARLREARADALLRDRPTTFLLAPDGGSFGVLASAMTPAPSGVTLSGGPAPNGRIVFFGDGSSSGGRILVTAAGRTLLVSVAEQTGVVRVVGS